MALIAGILFLILIGAIIYLIYTKTHVEMEEEILATGYIETQHEDVNFPDLPVGRLNGAVRLKQTLNLIYDGKIGIKLPDDLLLVNAVSEFSILGLNIYRLYLDDDQNSFIQIHCQNGEILDMTFFRQVDEVVPGDQEALNHWLHELIGAPDMHDPEENNYKRMWNNDIEDVVSPIEFDEEVFENETFSTDVFHNCMLFGRIFDEENGYYEYLFVDAEEEDGEHPVIRLYKGIDINNNDIELS